MGRCTFPGSLVARGLPDADLQAPADLEVQLLEAGPGLGPASGGSGCAAGAGFVLGSEGG